MKEIKLTGDALLQAMEGIPDEILERSEERGAGIQKEAETEARKAGFHIIKNGTGNKKEKARRIVIAGRLAMAAAALLLVLAGRNILFLRMGSGLQNAEPAIESTMESTTGYVVETEEAAGDTVTAGAAGDAKSADTFEEAAEAEESTAEDTMEDFVQKTAEEITEACRRVLRTIE